MQTRKMKRAKRAEKRYLREATRLMEVATRCTVTSNATLYTHDALSDFERARAERQKYYRAKLRVIEHLTEVAKHRAAKLLPFRI